MKLYNCGIEHLTNGGMMIKKILLAVIAVLLVYGIYHLCKTPEPLIAGTYSCHTEKGEYYFMVQDAVENRKKQQL